MKKIGLFAECLRYLLNFADVQAVSWENAYNLLREACASLKRGNAEAIALCAPIPRICLRTNWQ